MYDMVQLPEDRVHEAMLRVPPAALSLSATIPVGTVAELDVSVTDIVSDIVPPAVMPLELGVILRLVEWSWFTPRDTVPVLGACAVSPEYVPEMVTVTAEFVDVLYDTVQVPPASVQVFGLNVPPALPSLSVTVPAEVEDVFVVSDTDIVSVTDPPAFTVVGLAVIDVLVTSGVLEVELVLVWLSA